MNYDDLMELMDSFPNAALPDIKMMHLLGTGCFAPVNGALIIIVNCSGTLNIEEGKIGKNIADVSNILGAFISGFNFSLAGAMAVM